jgi:CheY-like chemotaxis protein
MTDNKIRTVMVVDDEPSNIKVAGAILLLHQ